MFHTKRKMFVSILKYGHEIIKQFDSCGLQLTLFCHSSCDGVINWSPSKMYSFYDRGKYLGTKRISSNVRNVLENRIRKEKFFSLPTIRQGDSDIDIIIVQS